MVLVDTNVIIEAFKGNPETMADLEEIGLENIAISTITEMELYIGALNKKELNIIRNRLSKISLVHFDEDISKKSAELIFKFSKSHTLDIPDSIIAATCLEKDMKLFTYNIKDFKYLPGINLFHP